MTSSPSLPVSLLPAPSPAISRRIVYFMRTIDCPICRGHVRRLVELSPQLAQRGADIVIVAPEAGAAFARDWIAAQPFPVVAADALVAQGGFGVSFAIQQSGTLIVATDGTILRARRATLPFQAFNEREVLEALTETVRTAA
jgi:peroxiredoxin